MNMELDLGRKERTVYESERSAASLLLVVPDDGVAPVSRVLLQTFWSSSRRCRNFRFVSVLILPLFSLVQRLRYP